MHKKEKENTLSVHSSAELFRPLLMPAVSFGLSDYSLTRTLSFQRWLSCHFKVLDDVYAHDEQKASKAEQILLPLLLSIQLILLGTCSRLFHRKANTILRKKYSLFSWNEKKTETELCSVMATSKVSGRYAGVNTCFTTVSCRPTVNSLQNISWTGH